MKKINLLILITAMGIALSSCEKMDCIHPDKKESSDCVIIPAKIIRYDCDRVILQLLSNEGIGDANWEDKSTGINYNNVVSYYNTCKINTLTNGELTTLYVNLKKITENLQADDCIQCMAISDNVPDTKVDLTSISKKPCGEDLNK